MATRPRCAIVPLADWPMLLRVNVTQLLFTSALQTLRYNLGSSHRVARCSVSEALAFLGLTGARKGSRETWQFSQCRRLAAGPADGLPSPCYRLDLRKDQP